MRRALACFAIALCVAPALGAQSAPRGMASVRLSIAKHALQRGDTLRADDIAIVDTTIVWHWTTIAPDTTRAQIGWVARGGLFEIALGQIIAAKPGISYAQAVDRGCRRLARSKRSLKRFKSEPDLPISKLLASRRGLGVRRSQFSRGRRRRRWNGFWNMASEMNSQE